MKPLISSVTLTSGLALGLVATTNLKPVQAATWTYTGFTTDKDCYVDSRNPSDNFCDSDYLTTGFWSGATIPPNDNTARQNVYVAFDLSNIITEIQDEIADSDSAFVRVVAASVSTIQTSENPDNPNNDVIGGGRSTVLGTAQRITGFEARVADPWDEATLTFDTQPSLSTDILFTGGISASATGTTPNVPYTGQGLNEYLDVLLNEALEDPGATSELSLGIRSTSALPFLPQSPFFLYPIEDWQSSDSGNPFEFNLTLEVFDALEWDNFNNAGKDGATGDWEHALRGENNSVEDTAQQEWINATNGANVPFRLTYNKDTGEVIMIIEPGTDQEQVLTYTSTASIGQPIEGLRLFASVLTGDCSNPALGERVSPDTTTTLRVVSYREEGSNTDIPILPVDDGQVVVSGGSIPSYNSDEQIISFGSDVSQIDGTMGISWPEDGVNPQESCGGGGASAGSRVQMSLIPLTTIPQPADSIGGANSASQQNAFLAAAEDDMNIQQSVPEPSSVIGLLVFGLAGVGLGRHRQDKD